MSEATVICCKCQNRIEISDLLDADLRLIADDLAHKLAKAEARITELKRDNATYLSERQQIRELAGHGNHEYGPDLVQCVKRQAERITELESARFCIHCNGTGRDWDQHGEFDCCHCKAAEIRRAAKAGGK